LNDYFGSALHSLARQKDGLIIDADPSDFYYG
jgi:hypothetical protein